MKAMFPWKDKVLELESAEMPHQLNELSYLGLILQLHQQGLICIHTIIVYRENG